MDTKLITKNLKTHWAGKKILFKESVDSTNSWASQCLEKEPRGTIFLAGFQTAGHGRMKRGWESPAGKNILLSLIDKPPGDEGRTHQLTLVAGIGFASGLASLFPKLSLGLKWPNDIVVSGKKLGGILCEFDPKPGKVVIGVGLNVNAGKNDFSAEVQKIATSLSIETGKSSPLEPLIAACLNGYETWREESEDRRRRDRDRGDRRGARRQRFSHRQSIGEKTDRHHRRCESSLNCPYVCKSVCLYVNFLDIRT